MFYLLFVDAREPGESEEVRRAKGFIRDLFVVSINTVLTFYGWLPCVVLLLL